MCFEEALKHTSSNSYMSLVNWIQAPCSTCANLEFICVVCAVLALPRHYSSWNGLGCSAWGWTEKHFWVCGYLKPIRSVSLKSNPDVQSPSVQSEECDGGSYCHLPLHHESSRMLLVHWAAELKLVGKVCGIPMALQADPGLRVTWLFVSWVIHIKFTWTPNVYQFVCHMWKVQWYVCSRVCMSNMLTSGVCCTWSSLSELRYLYGLEAMAMTVPWMMHH